MSIDRKVIENMFNGLPSKAQVRLKRAVKLIVNAKEKGGKVAAVVGSGPNLHEGVTTLLAELIHKGIIDGVSTSSAVINHEMAGTLEKVRRFDGVTFGFEREKLPSDGFFEVSILSKERLEEIQREIPIDIGLYEKMLHAKGDIIIKVAGNMAYPTGLRTERLARDVLAMAKRCGVPFEQMAGYGADRLTMIGAGAEHNIPVLVTVPQLIGGGEVGLAVGDSLSLSERCYRIANLLDRAYGLTGKGDGRILLLIKRLCESILILIWRGHGCRNVNLKWSPMLCTKVFPRQNLCVFLFAWKCQDLQEFQEAFPL